MNNPVNILTAVLAIIGLAASGGAGVKQRWYAVRVYLPGKVKLDYALGTSPLEAADATSICHKDIEWIEVLGVADVCLKS